MKKSPVTVLYFLPSLARGGQTNQVFSLANNLDRDRFLPVVLTISSTKVDDASSLFATAGIPIYSMGFTRHVSAGAIRQKLIDWVNKLGAGIVHSSGVRCDYLASSIQRLSERHCMTIHCTRANDSYGRLGGKLLMGMQRRSIQRCRYPVACSNSVAAWYKERHGYEMKTITNGIGPVHFGEPDAPCLQVCMIGSLCKLKDPETVIRSLSLLSSSASSIRLSVFGEGELEARCREIAGPNIAFMGFQSDVQQRLGDYDVLVSASISEGYPMAVLEGGSSGCFLVLSDIPPHREIVKDGAFGQLFSIKDHRSLADILNRLDFCELRETRSERASLFNERHSVNRMAKAYMDLYSEMLSNSRDTGRCSAAEVHA